MEASVFIFGSSIPAIIAKDRWNAIIVGYIHHAHNKTIRMNTHMDEEKFRQSVSMFDDVYVEQLKDIHVEYRKLLLIIFIGWGLYLCINVFFLLN